MIAVALPNVVDEFDTSLSSAAWLVTAYLLAMASVQPLAGKLGDVIGRRRLILAALVMFSAVSVGAALAPNIWVVLIFRVGQAISISIALANGVAVMRQRIPSERRGKSFGLVEAATGLSAAAGPLVGGLLVTGLDWRAIFFVNIPFLAVAIALAWRALPHDARSDGMKGFDYLGAALLLITLSAFAVFFLMLARGGSPAIYGPVGVSAIVLALLLITVELRHRSPVLQPRFFRNRGFAAPSGAVGTSNLAMYSMLLVVPLLLASRGSYSELEIGVVLTSLSVGMALLTPIGGRMADRFGRRLPAVLGLSLGAFASLLLAFSGAEIGIAPLVISLGFIGVGMGLSSTGMRVSAVESIPVHHAGSGAGVYSTSRYFGSIVGSAILAGLIGVERTNTDGIGNVFIVVSVSAFLAVGAAAFMVARPARQSD